MMLTKKELNKAIEHLQKVIRKGAVSNEYMHTGRVHSDDGSVGRRVPCEGIKDRIQIEASSRPIHYTDY
jgi:hypothetical protein